MFNVEIALKLEKEQLERKFQSATGKKPGDIFPKYQDLTVDQQVQSLKHVPMARVARAEQAMEAIDTATRRWSNHEYDYIKTNVESDNYDSALADGYEELSGNGNSQQVLRRKKDYA